MVKNWEELATLVVRVKEEDSEAFAELYNGMYQKVYFLAHSIVQDEYLAQDVVQEVFICVYKSIHSLENNMIFTAWLNRITYHCALKILKKNDELPVLEEALERETAAASTYEPLETVLRKETTDTMIEKISELPPEYGETLMLKYYQNLKLEEIAKELNCSIGTVKSRLSRGRQALKKRCLPSRYYIYEGV